MKKIYFTVGAPTYNEAKNIGKFFEAVQNQSLPNYFVLKELIVIASGCTDDTVNIIKKHQHKDKRIRLITQPKREGKVAAVNILLREAKTKLFILQSTDTIPAKTCYKYLLAELIKPEVGLTAGKIVPKDDPNTFCGFANHFRWKLHHDINLKYPERPKVGELIAFKKIFERIPPRTVVDEASVEPLIHLQGYKIRYIPKAIVYNQGPKTIREYLSRRRSIHAGHHTTKRKYAYEVVTYSSRRIIPVMLQELHLNPKYLAYATLTVLFEIIARFFGFLDVRFKLRNQAVWKLAKTSKDF